MPYMNYTPGPAGGSAMGIDPAAGGPGGSVPGGGGDDAFLNMLAMARADKKRKARDQMELERRELGMQEGRDLQAKVGESERRQFADREMRGRERGDAQRMALEGAKFRAGQPDQMDREDKLRTMMAKKGQPLVQGRMSNIKMEAMSPLGDSYKEAVNPAGYGYDDTDFTTSRGLATGGNPRQRFQGHGSSGGGGASIGPGGTTEHQLTMEEARRRAGRGG